MKNTFYLYTIPQANQIGFIEGDKMPVRPVYSDHVQHTHYYWQVNKYNRLLKQYEDKLESAKASYIPVHNREEAIRLIWKKGDKANIPLESFVNVQLKEDVLHGPFEAEYEIEELCATDGSKLKCTHECECKQLGYLKSAMLLSSESPKKQRKFSQEKDFDAKLNLIGELYEEGKDCLNSFQILEEDRAEWSRMFEVLRELRDIAATSLKANHEIKDN